MKAMLGVMLGVLAGFAGAALAIQSGWLPAAEGQAGPGGGAGAGQGQTILATGGSTQNQNDLCWVLTRVKPARGPERTVLALYRAERMGETFSLRSVRAIDADLRAIDMHAKDKKPSVNEVLEALPPEESAPLRPPPK
jgi:hypothetical protein